MKLDQGDYSLVWAFESNVAKSLTNKNTSRCPWVLGLFVGLFGVIGGEDFGFEGLKDFGVE